jgi:hypothetical protein
MQNFIIYLKNQLTRLLFQITEYRIYSTHINMAFQCEVAHVQRYNTGLFQKVHPFYISDYCLFGVCSCERIIALS